MGLMPFATNSAVVNWSTVRPVAPTVPLKLETSVAPRRLNR